MARARPGLAKAIHEILGREGVNGKRLSYRQAERLTGLSPATIGELAKGNARTAETVRRFALGMGEEADRLLMLAGFVPEPETPGASDPGDGPKIDRIDVPSLELEVQDSLERWSAALTQLPAGRERDLWVERLRCDVELLERSVERYRATVPPPSTGAAVGAEEIEEDSC
jgi:transcriptional regulator with XRE-family HTH domain